MGWPEKMIAMAVNVPTQLLRELDAEDNELAVRERLAAGKYNTWQSGVVNEWLRRKSDDRQTEAAARAEAREEEILSIAKEANRLASEANSIARSQASAAWRAARYAMYAAIIAATIMVVEKKDQILALIYP